MRLKLFATLLLAMPTLSATFAAQEVESASRPAVEVNSWHDTRDYPVNPKLRFDPQTNPYDPKKHEEVTVIACNDGRFEFVACPNDATRPLKIVIQPDRRDLRKKYAYYQDPTKNLSSIEDPFAQSLSRAVYLKLYDPSTYNRTGSSLAKMKPPLSGDQRAAELAARKPMQDACDALDAKVNAGTFEPELFKDIRDELGQFQADGANILSDGKKQGEARLLLALAAKYNQKIDEAKNAEVAKYVEQMGRILTDEQKQSLVKNAADPAATTKPASAPQ